MSNLYIIIPCYNEEKRLHQNEVEKLLNLIPESKIIFANDGSTDQTVSVLQSIQKIAPDRIEIYDFTQNEGKAKVVYKSIHKALENPEVDYIAYLDADFSTNAKNFKLIYDGLMSSRKKFALGSRVKLLGRRIDRKVSRHYIGRFIVTFLGFKHALPVYDTQCGAKIFHRSIFEQALTAPFKCSWLFDYEFLIRLKKQDLLKEGIEIPIHEWIDVAGSKLGYKSAIKILREILTIYSIPK
ncbi:MAG: glycosyltransferase [Flavobacteriales bacterium]|jgi:glycosyltransferase involved in cell wall biosynthesis|nr:glycosyltransferase [Flavobacteriales bacterium]